MTKNQMRRAKKKEQKKAQSKVSSSWSSDHRPSLLMMADCQASSPKPTDTSGETDTETETVLDNDKSMQPEQAEVAELAVKPSTSEVKMESDGPADDASVIVDEDDPTYAMYKDILNKFGMSLNDDDVERDANAGIKGEVFFDQDDEIPSEDEETGHPQQMSKKKRKKLNTLSIAELKALVKTPEVVEWQDVSSSDPRLLVQIKAQRNVVPVPTHWSLKREYRETTVQVAAVHCRDRHYRDARRSAGEAGRTDTEAEAEGAGATEDGQARHRLPETLRCFLPLSDETQPDAVW